MKIKDYNPGIAFILCNKKINQRIFKQDDGQTGRSRTKGGQGVMNPTSGTIIGSGISRYKFDFHLAAQYVNQGTCTPTQFLVI